MISLKESCNFTCVWLQPVQSAERRRFGVRWRLPSSRSVPARRWSRWQHSVESRKRLSWTSGQERGAPLSQLAPGGVRNSTALCTRRCRSLRLRTGCRLSGSARGQLSRLSLGGSSSRRSLSSAFCSVFGDGGGGVVDARNSRVSRVRNRNCNVLILWFESRDDNRYVFIAVLFHKFALKKKSKDTSWLHLYQDHLAQSHFAKNSTRVLFFYSWDRWWDYKTYLFKKYPFY